MTYIKMIGNKRRHTPNNMDNPQNEKREFLRTKLQELKNRRQSKFAISQQFKKKWGQIQPY